MDANAKLSATNLVALSVVATFGLRNLDQQLERLAETQGAVVRLESEVRDLNRKIEITVRESATKVELEKLRRIVDLLSSCISEQRPGEKWRDCR